MLATALLSRICTLVVLVASLALAATPTSFCKCTCAGTYKIIPLDARTGSDAAGAGGETSFSLRSSPFLMGGGDGGGDSKAASSGHHRRQEEGNDSGNTDGGGGSNDGKGDGDGDGDGGATRKEYRQKNCNDCNRVFCLEQNIPECKDAGGDQVFATCFQRDSSKDEAVVFIFLFTTVGLLGWALLRPCVDRLGERRRERTQYIPVADQAR